MRAQWQQPAQRWKPPRRPTGHGAGIVGVGDPAQRWSSFTPGKSCLFFELFACQLEQGVYFKTVIKIDSCFWFRKKLTTNHLQSQMLRRKLSPFLTSHGCLPCDPLVVSKKLKVSQLEAHRQREISKLPHAQKSQTMVLYGWICMCWDVLFIPLPTF